jgi:predicted nucleotidyltransferase
MRALIDEKLDAIVREEGVRILFAVESGSRAWGFPSPDSDYDVRFVYVRPLDWYLSIFEGRDVIELPIEDDLDINGWDLKKALQLLVKPNPVLLEWLRSPIVYRSEPDAVARMTTLAEHTDHLRPSTYHYLHLAEGQYDRIVDGRDEVPLKKYFYVLRPAMALRFLRLSPDKPVPMDLASLISGADMPKAATDLIDVLRARKAVTRELGNGPRMAEIDTFVQAEIADAKARLDTTPEPRPHLLAEANALFRDLVKGAA